jgi:hypothetical protein
MDEQINTPSIQVPNVRFIAEKQGPVEREFESRLLNYFKGNLHLKAAYLLLVRYGDSDENKVALGLVADKIAHSDLANAAILEFKQMFRTTDSLDIIFLTSDQEQRAASVAKPFYIESSSVA